MVGSSGVRGGTGVIMVADGAEEKKRAAVGGRRSMMSLVSIVPSCTLTTMSFPMTSFRTCFT